MRILNILSPTLETAGGLRAVALYFGDEEVDWLDCSLEHDRAFFCGGDADQFFAANAALGISGGNG